jgi:hypothetical protein
MKTYKCITMCTWGGRLWREGVITSPYPDSVILPEHFEVYEDDKEDEEESTNEEYTYETLICKKFKALQKISKERGVYDDSLRTNEQLVNSILGAN